MKDGSKTKKTIKDTTHPENINKLPLHNETTYNKGWWMNGVDDDDMIHLITLSGNLIL